MALTYSKKFHFLLKKNYTRNLFAALFQRSNFQNVFSVAQYSDSSDSSKGTINRAMKAYLEKVVVYENFMKEQLQEYNRGKEFLASMMGRKSKEMTQKDIDEAIDYLFPSALLVRKARPMLKPPQEIYEKQKKAAFDYSGRPFHFLFYTSKPNFSQCLHDAASKLQELNLQLFKDKSPPKPMTLVGGRWISQKELEEKLQEGIYTSEYEKFMEVFKKLAEHPLSSLAEDLIKQFWVYEKILFDMKIPEVKVTEDGTEVVNVIGARRKTAIAHVKVSKPGTGEIRINHLGIDYFYDMQARQQPCIQARLGFSPLASGRHHTVAHQGSRTHLAATLPTREVTARNYFVSLLILTKFPSAKLASSK